MFRNLFSRLERQRAKNDVLKNPPERTPFQRWSDEFASLASKAEHTLSVKPLEADDESFEAWHKNSFEPLMRELANFKERWDAFRGSAFSSSANFNIDALIQKARTEGASASQE